MQENEKIRIRSEEERKHQGESLSLVKDVLVSHNLKPIISGGTLLGAVRDGDFIAWDWDAEFFLLFDEVQGLQQSLIDSLEKHGFQITRRYPEPNRWKITAANHGFEIELRAWSRDGDYYRRLDFRVPASLLAATTKVSLRGETYFAPDPADAYLRYVYGDDWQIPLRTAVKSDYLSSMFYDDTVDKDEKKRGGVKSWHSTLVRRLRRIVKHIISRARPGNLP